MRTGVGMSSQQAVPETGRIPGVINMAGVDLRESKESVQDSGVAHRSRAGGRVLICGGGVAAIEALLALRALLEVGVDVHLLAPDRELVYQPLAVAAPFDLDETRHFELAAIARDQGAELHLGALASVEGDGRRVLLAGGGELAYDYLIIATGAQRHEWLRGALHFGGEADVGSYRELLQRLEGGSVDQLCFVNPAGTSWTLPLYELALLTASHLADRGISGVGLTVVTPETEPLAVFGPAAGRMLRNLLADRGIALKTDTTAEAVEPGRLLLEGSAALAVDEVVTLAQLAGPALPGVPCDESGFIVVDEHSRVTGMHNVYAAGDGTNFPIKQGGLATQQADVAAEAIAGQAGAAITPSPLRPMLRGMLLTGIAPSYLRAELAADGALSQAAANPLWWPPSKIAGRYLGPYLASHSALEHGETLKDRSASSADPAALSEAHSEARELALVFAERDADDGHFRSALDWLEVLEQIDGVLPVGYVEKRTAWQARSRGRITGSR